MQIKSVSLVKRVRDGDGFKAVYPITVAPTISKFGEGLDKIQLIITAGDTKTYVSLNQMENFCRNVLELIQLLKMGYYLLGEEEVYNAINKLYEKRVSTPTTPTVGMAGEVKSAVGVEETSSSPMVVEVNGVKGIIKDGKFFPIAGMDIQTV